MTPTNPVHLTPTGAEGAGAAPMPLKVWRHLPNRCSSTASSRATTRRSSSTWPGQGRSLPDTVQQEFEDFLKCGRLEHGFLRARCDTCHAEHLVAFSCKRRGFCPSCGARRMAESAALLVDEVFPERAAMGVECSLSPALSVCEPPRHHGCGPRHRLPLHRHAFDPRPASMRSAPTPAR